MEMHKIALIGAGAVGAYFIWGFAGLEDVELTVIADGDRKERLARGGLTINGKNYPLLVKASAEAGEQDLVLIAVKHGALEDALELLPALVGPDTLVLSLLNGVDSEEKVAAAVGEDHVVPALIRIASRRTGEGVTFDPAIAEGISFGLPAGREAEGEKLDRLTALFSKTPLHFRAAEDILTALWAKYACNIANNLPQAVVGVPASLYHRSEHGLFLAQKLWSEVVAVAASRGIALREEVMIFTGVTDAARYSTLQDLEAGRHTEVDMFLGELTRMAAEAGISTPYSEFTYHIIKALEEKNDGRF